MSLALLFHYLLLNMFRMLVHPSSGACERLWIYFMCCIALVRCVLVLRCGSAGVVWCGILMQGEAGCCGILMQVETGWCAILMQAEAGWCGVLMQAEAGWCGILM